MFGFPGKEAFFCLSSFTNPGGIYIAIHAVNNISFEHSENISHRRDSDDISLLYASRRKAQPLLYGF